MKDIFVDCPNGLSGDMLLSAFFDLGISLDIVNNPLKILGLNNLYSLQVEEYKSYGIRGLITSVNQRDKESKYIYWKDIRNLISNSNIKTSLKEKVIKVFSILAEAEAFVHGIEIDLVHFHEIGSIDSIVDIVGVCALIEYLNPRNIYCTTPPVGSGFVNSSHGKLPVPVPAVLELAKKYRIKLNSKEIENSFELTTPTGLALMIAFCDYFRQPDYLLIDSIGLGFGHHKLDRPNFLRICLLEGLEHKTDIDSSKDISWEKIVCQEAWIDDSTPEDLAFLIKQLKKAGAFEVVSQSIQMKKARTGICVKSLCKVEDVDTVRFAWFSYGTSIGLKERLEGRWTIPRRTGKCLTKFGYLAVKAVRWPDGRLTLKPEHDDLIRISLDTGISLEDIRKDILLDYQKCVFDKEWEF